MPPRARSRSRSRQPSESSEKKTRSRRTSVAAKSATASPARPLRETPLPFAEHSNALLLGSKAKASPLKLQQLSLDNDVHITICRVKVPTPKGVSGHLIRRLDTNALSASSLYRVAFPTASEEDEEAEMTYLAAHYDTVTAGHLNEAHRLTGVWIPIEDAITLAADYNMSHFIGDLVAYVPGAELHTSTLTAPSSAPDAASTPLRNSKRQRTKSPAAASGDDKSSVIVSQTIVSDPATGELAETTQVTIEGEGLMGSDATVEKAVADARKMVDTLKAQGTLPTIDSEMGRPARGKKRAAAEIEADLVPATPSFLNRVFRTIGPAQRPIAPAHRRLIALGGVLLTGVAAASAPYLLG